MYVLHFLLFIFFENQVRNGEMVRINDYLKNLISIQLWFNNYK
jgi:hypothetical protein